MTRRTDDAVIPLEIDRPGTRAGSWLRCYVEHADARLRLVCFPHAGGSAAFFRDWSRRISPTVDLRVVQYPGRGDRAGAPMVDDARSLAESVVDELRALPSRPLALFGHSMGALLAYEAARLLTGSGAPPARLFVSGALAAHDPARVAERVSGGSDEQVIERLRRLGGTDSELLADPELRKIFLPYVRNDFRLVECYRHRPGPRLRMPISVLTGADDPAARAPRTGRWAELTDADCTVRVLPGGHFFLVPEQSAVLAEIHDRLSVPWASTV